MSIELRFLKAQPLADAAGVSYPAAQHRAFFFFFFFLEEKGSLFLLSACDVKEIPAPK